MPSHSSDHANTLQIVLETLDAVDDLHRAAAEHVARAHQQWKPDLGRALERLGRRAGRSVRRRLVAEPVEQRTETRTVFSEVDRVGGRPEYRNAGFLQPGRQLQRGLATELDYHALGLLDLTDPEDVLERQWLEVQAIGGVVVGRDGLRIAVDHHRIATRLAHRLRGVHAAVVELDPLADAVGA